MKQHHLVIRALAATVAFCAVSSFVIARAAGCTAASVTSAHVASFSNDGGLIRYHIFMRVTNNTSRAQPGDTLQVVDIRHAGNKIDAISVPPLKSRGSYTTVYTFARSRGAGNGTTTLKLQLEMRQPQCNTLPAYSITF